MKIASINSINCKTPLKSYQPKQHKNTYQTNPSFEGKHTGLKLYGGFAGIMSTLAGLAAFGLSTTTLIISTCATMLGAAWGSMLDSEAEANKRENK